MLEISGQQFPREGDFKKIGREGGLAITKIRVHTGGALKNSGWGHRKLGEGGGQKTFIGKFFLPFLFFYRCRLFKNNKVRFVSALDLFKYLEQIKW